jgi:uncharacterized membrane protein YjgN (DUF898 family)
MDNETTQPEEKVPTPFQHLEFRGNAGEYFKIWIVNIALTILTLGIYSAWAKVRTNRYFYANTYLNSDPFSYNARALPILYGRLLVVGFYGLFILFNDYLLFYDVAAFMMIAFILLLPYLIRQSLRFKLRYISYRNIPFAYKGKVKQLYGFFILHALLNLITLGFAFIYSLNQFNKLKIQNSHYGEKSFFYDQGAWGVYKIAFLVNIVSIVIFFAVMFIMGFVSGLLGIKAIASLAPLIGMILVFSLYKGLWDAMLSNYIYSNTLLQEDNPLKSQLSAKKLSWIYFSNFLLQILSLGLLTPWAKVRLARYKLACLSIACSDYDAFTHDITDEDSALGEEAADFFDIDLGF